MADPLHERALTAPSRATRPLLRKQGELIPVTWEEAFDVMVERFRSIQNKYGKQSLGVIGTGQLVTEEFYALGKLVQLGLGTSNFDGNTTLCMGSAVSGYKLSLASIPMPLCAAVSWESHRWKPNMRRDNCASALTGAPYLPVDSISAFRLAIGLDSNSGSG